MAQHGERAHATWSASASDRRWACPGSLAMEANGPADRESFAAAWGTACHQIADKVLRGQGEPVDYAGSVEKTKSHEIDVDDEVIEVVQTYVDYVRERAAGKTLLVEQKFSLGKLNPPFDAGGTGDAVILDPDNGAIEIVDLKGGRGVVVEALANKQLRTYALGAVLANPGPWRTVRVTIVQPRAPHPDGRIRSDVFDSVDLFDWTADLNAAMAAAKAAMAEPHKHLSPGDHCGFCKAKPTCPALRTASLAAAHTYFAPEGAKVPPPPETLGVDQIVKVLDAADMIEGWLSAVRAYAHEQAESGIEIASGESRYILVAKQARRKWAGDEDATADALAVAAKRPRDEFFGEPKLLSPAQVDKLLGKKAAGDEAVKALWTKESSGHNLVRADKTTRPAELPLAQKMFQIEQGA